MEQSFGALGWMTIGICLVTLVWALVLIRRVPWRTGFLCLFVGLMPLTQVMLVLKSQFGIQFEIPDPIAAVAELIVSVLFFVAILILTIDSYERRRVEMRLRMAESVRPEPVRPIDASAAQTAASVQ
ncbi:MAG: hypothetical protein ACK5AZ_10020 [Bryobacteraceae bacterium]